MNSNEIHASQINAGDVVETIPSIASGVATAVRIDVTRVESFEVNGQTFYDLHHANGTHTNLTGNYRIVSKAN